MTTAGQPVRFTAHARARYVERVRPALDSLRAGYELMHLAQAGILATEPPGWCSWERETRYLVVADVVFPLAFHASDGFLIATTCLVKHGNPRRRVRASQRAQRLRRGWRHQVDADSVE